MKHKNVYTVAEEQSHSYYQLPKELFISERYRKLSINAKVLYSVLLDRMSLSRKNNWVDEFGQIFFLYTRENIMQLLNISKPTASKTFKELSEAGLIIEERQGLNKPNKIYLCPIKYEGKYHLPPKVKDMNPSYNDLSKPEKNNNPIIRENVSSEKSEEDASLAYYNLYDKESLLEFTYSPQVVEIIYYYVTCYKDRFSKIHPRIKKDQLKKVWNLIADVYNLYFEDTDEWFDLIDQYFEKRNIGDGNINRFFSGDLQHGVIQGMLLKG